MANAWPSGLCAFLTAFLLVALPGGRAVAFLKRLGARQNINVDAPATHSTKQGTPTMGGLLFLGVHAVVVIAYMLLTRGSHRRPVEDFALLPLLLLTLAFGGIGFLDDYLSAKRGKNLGLRAREKFGLQILAAGMFAGWLYITRQVGVTTIVDILPFGSGTSADVDVGPLYYVLVVLLIVAFSNATNFTDGLDGLCSGVTLAICFALAILFGDVLYARLNVFVLALAGGVAGFLWWNAHPARMFMGDTGSLPIGAALASAAVVGKQEVALIVASLVCWAELFSVIIQVTVFKVRRKTKGLEYAKAHRVFRRTPFHHHFEELGWPETQIVIRFWVASALCALTALLWARG